MGHRFLQHLSFAIKLRIGQQIFVFGNVQFFNTIRSESIQEKTEIFAFSILYLNRNHGSLLKIVINDKRKF